jgi:hypothetical protein
MKIRIVFFIIFIAMPFVMNAQPRGGAEIECMEFYYVQWDYRFDSRLEEEDLVKNCGNLINYYKITSQDTIQEFENAFMIFNFRESKASSIDPRMVIYIKFKDYDSLLTIFIDFFGRISYNKETYYLMNIPLMLSLDTYLPNCGLPDKLEGLQDFIDKDKE